MAKLGAKLAEAPKVEYTPEQRDTIYGGLLAASGIFGGINVYPTIHVDVSDWPGQPEVTSPCS